MLLAFVLIVIGLAATVYGVRLINERHRPIDLAGALLAAAGLAVALAGVGRLLSKDFF
jgi:drug/metabolite transporter (DMT)-like permease